MPKNPSKTSKKRYSMFKPSNNDMSENPPSPEHLLRGFHGRRVRDSSRGTLPINVGDLQDAICLGRSEVIFYHSDKRDPKDPTGEGAQGYKKRFYHDQNPLSYLWVIAVTGLDAFQSNLASECRENGFVEKARKKGLIPAGPLPQKIVELGALEKVVLSQGRGGSELEFINYTLFVWDNGSTLMGLPMINGEILDANVYLWSSNHTRVNWRGIID